MKKLLTIILAFLLNCSCVCAPILAEQSYNEITDHETIREEKVFIDEVQYTCYTILTSEGTFTTYVNECEVMVYDQNNCLVGCQRIMHKDKPDFSDDYYIGSISITLPEKRIIKKGTETRGGAPTMYNTWTSWYAVSNTVLVWDLSLFFTVNSLAAAMFGAVSNQGVSTKYATWVAIAWEWYEFLGHPITKTSTLYRRMNTECNIVVKESAYSTNADRDANYNVVWLENPWVYDIYPYACRYLWDKDL